MATAVPSDKPQTATNTPQPTATSTRTPAAAGTRPREHLNPPQATPAPTLLLLNPHQATPARRQATPLRLKAMEGRKEAVAHQPLVEAEAAGNLARRVLAVQPAAAVVAAGEVAGEVHDVYPNKLNFTKQRQRVYERSYGGWNVAQTPQNYIYDSPTPPGANHPALCLQKVREPDEPRKTFGHFLCNP